jgi:hypothetical protein
MGVQTRTCGDDGMWSGSPPVCLIIVGAGNLGLDSAGKLGLDRAGNLALDRAYENYNRFSKVTLLCY